MSHNLKNWNFKTIELFSTLDKKNYRLLFFFNLIKNSKFGHTVRLLLLKPRSTVYFFPCKHLKIMFRNFLIKHDYMPFFKIPNRLLVNSNNSVYLFKMKYNLIKKLLHQQ